MKLSKAKLKVTAPGTVNVLKSKLYSLFFFAQSVLIIQLFLKILSGMANSAYFD